MIYYHQLLTEKLDRSRARVKVPTTQLSLPNGSNDSTPRVSPYKNQHPYGRNIHTIHDDRSPIKPKNILLILAGTRPHLKVESYSTVRFKKILCKSVTLWEHLTKRYYFWTI